MRPPEIEQRVGALLAAIVEAPLTTLISRGDTLSRSTLHSGKNGSSAPPIFKNKHDAACRYFQSLGSVPSRVMVCVVTIGVALARFFIGLRSPSMYSTSSWQQQQLAQPQHGGQRMQVVWRQQSWQPE